MPCQSHPPWLDHSNYTWRRVKYPLMRTKISILRCALNCAIYVQVPLRLVSDSTQDFIACDRYM
jgi:hypothetical protein